MPIVSSQYAREYAKEINSSNQIFVNSSSLNFDLEYISLDNGANCWLNYIEINAKRQLKAVASQFNFRNIEHVGGGIGAYKIVNGAGMEVWDVTNPTAVETLITEVDNETLIFLDSLGVERVYCVFDNSFYLKPNYLGMVPNQNIRNTSSDISEFIIVSHPKFLEAAQRLF